MLRRRPDDTFELRLVEEAIRSVRPAPLSADRREALRLRIMGSLGEQARREALFGLAPSERWLAIPAGVGIAAAIFAAVRLADRLDDDGITNARTDWEVPLGPSDTAPDPAELPLGREFVAENDTWRYLDSEIYVGLSSGSAVRYERVDGIANVHFSDGELTVATREAGVVIRGGAWTVTMSPESVATFETSGGLSLVKAVEGRIMLSEDGGPGIWILPGSTQAIGTVGAEQGEPSAAPRAQDDGTPMDSAELVGAPAGIPANQAAPSFPAVVPPPAAGVVASIPAPAPIGVPPSPPAAASSAAPDFGGAPDSNPPESNPPAPEPPATGAGSEQGGNGNANGEGNGSNGNGNANGEGNGNPGNGNANGEGNGNANGEGNGNSGNGNNGEGNGNSGNGNANGEGNGNANGEGAGNNGNGNANGEGNGNNGNGNAFGHDNGNNGNGNANGQGNGNANGNAALKDPNEDKKPR